MFDKDSLTDLGFVPMDNHDPNFYISRTGKIYDLRNQVFLNPCMYRGCEYPSVVLASRGARKTYELPRLVYLYFVDSTIPTTTRIALVDDEDPFNFATSNLKAVPIQEYKKKSRGPRITPPSDDAFFNWNDTALYC